MPALLVRKTLTQIIQGKRASPVIHTGRYLSEIEILKHFKEPILVYEVTQAKYWAYDVAFIFKNFPQHEFQAAVGYPDDKPTNDVDAIVDAGPEDSAKLRKRLQKKEFSSFWLP